MTGVIVARMAMARVIVSTLLMRRVIMPILRRPRSVTHRFTGVHIVRI
jgi:hypothetical protein